MKIKVGTKFKHIEGLGKGKSFTVISVGSDIIEYRSDESGMIYEAPRKNFEKYLQRVRKYWADTNKAYKHKKGQLKGE